MLLSTLTPHSGIRRICRSLAEPTGGEDKMICRTCLVIVSSLIVVTVGCGGGQEQSVAPEKGAQAAGAETFSPAVIDHVVESLSGETVDLAAFRGKAMLIVNTASECGYTPQYEGLQKLHERYGEDGLVVIGFPSNDFKQEPGTAEEIGKFCRLNYGVTFPMMAKVHVTGENQAPLYRTLTAESSEDLRGEVQWNFTKFLVDQEGHVVARFEPDVKPLDERIVSAVESLLAGESSQG
jgi:glutathione peroxidase